MPRPAPAAPKALPAWPAASIEMRPLTSLTANPANARKHPEAQIKVLMGLMRQHGWTTAVLLDEKDQMIAGHGRCLAAGRLVEEGETAFAEAPCMVARGWSAAQKRAYALADNRVSLMSTWDAAVLGGEMKSLEGLGVTLADLGFSEAEVFRALGSGGGKPPTTSFDPSEGPAVSKLGDVWILGDHRLACGDATKREYVDAVLAGEKPHLMVTDPPYGVSYDSEWRGRQGVGSGVTASGKVGNDDKADWRAAWLLFEGSVAYVWHAALKAKTVQESLEAAGFELRSTLIWDKVNTVIGRGHYHWQHEPCFYMVRPGGKSHWQGDRKQSTVWAIGHRANETGHSTQKPLEAMERPIINSSKKGDLVYEPFSGSGTTLLACQVTGRRCRAIELMPGYVDLAVRRWQGATNQVAMLEGGGTFEEVERARLSKTSAPQRPKKTKAAA